MGEQLPQNQAFTRGKVIARKRKALRPKLSQSALAKRAGVSRGSVQRAEADQPGQEHETLEKIALGLNTTIAALDRERDALNAAMESSREGQVVERQNTAPSNTASQRLAQKDNAAFDYGERPDAPQVGASEAMIMIDDVVAAAAIIARRKLGGNREHEEEWADRVIALAETIGRRRPPQNGGSREKSP